MFVETVRRGEKEAKEKANVPFSQIFAHCYYLLLLPARIDA